MNLQAIGKDLFNKIRGRFPGVTIGDSTGKITNKPEDARFFDFEFKEGGNVLGKVSISISEEDGLVVLHNKDMVEGADDGVKTSWYNFLKEMGQFAKARVLSFDTRDITKSNLEKRDYEFLGQGKEVDTMSESNLFGTTKTSFQSIGEARLVIKHSAPVDQSVAGGRTHKIESIFIESPEGERFKYPIKHLNGARAMARHVSEGGKPYDSFGKHITGLSEELSKLKSFKTYINRSNVMAEGLKEYQGIVDERIDSIKIECVKLQRSSNYKENLESFKESDSIEVPEDIKKNWIDELTIKTFKEELQDVFPYIYKLVTEKTAIQDLEPESFEAHGYQGGTEARRYEYDLAGDYSPEEPVSEKDAEQVKELLQKAGINADVQSREDRYQGIVIHTDAGKEEVEKVLGGMIETMGQVFGDFEDAMEQIVDEGNALFSQDPEEQKEAVEKLNQMMQKHFPVGVNGTNGIESIQGIIDDEDFNNAIEKASEENSDLCMRPMIMDYVMSKDPQLASRLDTGDMKKENASITFEDIKPYVSMYKGDDGKMVYDVLDKDEKSVFKTNKAEDAMKYLKKNFDKLRYKDVKEDKKDGFEYPEDGKYGYKAEVGKTDADITIHDSETDEILHIKDMQNVDIEDQETLAMIWDENHDGDERAIAAMKTARDQDESEESKPELPNATPEMVEEFIKSFFDYTTNKFPKGETAILTAVEKKFGEDLIGSAQETIHKMTAGNDQEIEKIKKLAGVK